MKPITHYWQSLNFVSLALAPFSFLFCLLVALRRFFYRIGLFKSSESKLPVIVVGNIYIGGSGKTPFVVWLVEHLKLAGYKPGIVSRGYGASQKAPWPRRVDLQQDVLLFGDEPYFLHKATQCPVVVDPIRTRAVDKIISDTDCDVIISDDGLQHYAMSRFIEINLTDARRLYGNGLCLPAGPLREAQRRLKSVDYIIYNTSSCQPGASALKMHRNEFTMDYDIADLKLVSGDSSTLPIDTSLDKVEQSMTLNDFKGKIVHAVAGIGDPGHFFKLLESHGLKIIEHPFDDHFEFRAEDIIFDEPYPIIMTEKDAVKCRSLFKQELPESKLKTDVWYLPIKAKVDKSLIKLIINQLKSYKIVN